MSTFLHRPPDLCLGAGHRPDAGRRRSPSPTLPVAQYPPIAPPAVSITVTYPGASAETVQSTVVQVIEQQLSGIDHLLYFSSESDKDGSMTITLYFDAGHQSRHRPGAGAEQAAAGDAAAAAGGAAAGHSGWPRRPRTSWSCVGFVSHRRQHELAATSAISSPRTVQDPISRDRRAWATTSCSARNTPCASGWIRRS